VCSPGRRPLHAVRFTVQKDLTFSWEFLTATQCWMRIASPILSVAKTDTVCSQSGLTKSYHARDKTESRSTRKQCVDRARDCRSKFLANSKILHAAWRPSCHLHITRRRRCLPR